MNERKVSGHKTDISWQINYFVWSGLVKRDMRNASVKKHDYYLSLKRSYLLLMPIDTIWWLYEDIRLKISLSQLEIIQIWLIKYWSAKCKGVTWTAHIHIMLTSSWYVHTLVTTLCVANYVTHYTSVSESYDLIFYTEHRIIYSETQRNPDTSFNLIGCEKWWHHLF